MVNSGKQVELTIMFDDNVIASQWYCDGEIYLNPMLSVETAAKYTYEYLKNLGMPIHRASPWFLDFYPHAEEKRFTINLDGSVLFRGEWADMKAVEYILALARLYNANDFK